MQPLLSVLSAALTTHHPLPFSLFVAYIVTLALAFYQIRALVAAQAILLAKAFVSRNRASYGANWSSLNSEKLMKFGESSYKLICHSSFAIFGFVYLRHQDFYTDTAMIWVKQDRWMPESVLHAYYLVQVSTAEIPSRYRRRCISH